MDIRLIATIAALFLFSFNAGAQEQSTFEMEQPWRIAKLSGTAKIAAPNREAMLIRPNRTLFAGQTLYTGARTRLLLTNGKQRIQVSSNSELALPKASDYDPSMTVILHRKGTIHLTVDKRKNTHFQVKTPYMVAAVKGTEFSVSISEGLADVRVHSGVVEVENKLGDEKFDVRAGETAAIDLSHLSRDTKTKAQRAFVSGAEDPDELEAAPTHMVFVTRGEQVSDVLMPKNLKQQAEDADEPDGVVDTLGKKASHLVKPMTTVVGGWFGSIFNWINEMILMAVLPLWTAIVELLAGVNYWLRIVMIAVVVGLVAGLGSITYYVSRRR
ncbi:FecR family protein [uncultured Cohaesibacter sp.]|uniref:FecR family protein n=1 Tax=uncultured Cohaesibacter sp. TaxID=1002546 RepID=UPI00292CC2C9|nr:FecR family protein [uncultured Cohaesibacter sp.]